MKCPECQVQNPEGIKFCGQCGSRLKKECPSCEFINPSNFIYCGECGYDLRGHKENPSTNYKIPQSYTPKHLANKILNIRGSIEGERKLVTVLFADVANFTSFSENIDSEEVHQIMDDCFKILIDEIHKYEGTVNQFTGDGVMALFGAPIAHEDHARRACQAALSLQNLLKDYGARIERDTNQAFQIRIGLNSGPVIVGTIGDDLRMDYTAMGDTTNLASRMENLAAPGSVLASASTHRLAREYFEFKSLDPVEVKGKKEPQETYQLLHPSDIGTRFEASMDKGLTKFVGRKHSMGALISSFEKALRGHGQIVGIVGEAGVGKSRLLMEFRQRLGSEVIYLEGNCLQFGSQMPFLPLLGILRHYFDLEEGEREFLVKKKLAAGIDELDKKLDHCLAPLQELFSVQVDNTSWAKLESGVKRERTFEALHDLFISLSQVKTLILVIEDLHWMDKSSEAFIAYFIDLMAYSPILLLLLYRPEYTHQWGSKTYYSKIGLDLLEQKPSIELIQAVLGEGEMTPKLKKIILGRAEGNPLFMEELTQTLLETDSIKNQAGRFELAVKDMDLQVPQTIQGIIAARMDRLEDNLKQTMQIASVIGRDFAFRLIKSITGMHDELKKCLLNLQSLEFIYEKQLFPDLEYIFKHALTQEVAYNSLLVKRRKEIHEQIGQAIERIYSDREEEFFEMLAYHYSKSDNQDKAAYYLKQAGIKAINSHAAHESFNYYQEALDVLCRMDETPNNIKDQLEVIEMAYAPMAYLGYLTRCLPMISRAEKIYANLGDDRMLAKWHSIRAKYHSYHGHAQEALYYSEKSFELAKKIQDVDLMAETAPGLHLSYALVGSHDKAIKIDLQVAELLEKADRTTEFFGHPYIAYCWLGGGAGSCLSLIGQFEQAMAWCKKTLQVARESNSQITLGFSEFYYGLFFHNFADFNLAKKYLHSSLTHFDEINFISVKGWTLSLLGLSCSYQGDFTAADAYFEQAFHFYKNSGIELAKPLMYAVSGAHYFESTDLSLSRQSLEKALNMARQQHAKFDESLSLIYLGRTIGKMGLTDLEVGEKYILEGINTFKKMKLRPYFSQGYLLLGDMYTDVGRIDEARRYLEKAKSNFKAMKLDFWLTRTQTSLTRL